MAWKCLAAVNPGIAFAFLTTQIERAGALAFDTTSPPPVFGMWIPMRLWVPNSIDAYANWMIWLEGNMPTT
jgi:hypothetical protein